MPKITIYSTATCGYCKMLKSYLRSKDISYKEKHVDQDPAVAEEMLAKSHQMGVPFTLIEQEDGSEVGVLGFDKQRIDQLLGKP